MTAFEDYRGRYRYVDLTRENGILQIRVHRDQQEAAWSSAGRRHSRADDLGYGLALESMAAMDMTARLSKGGGSSD